MGDCDQSGIRQDNDNGVCNIAVFGRVFYKRHDVVSAMSTCNFDENSGKNMTKNRLLSKATSALATVLVFSALFSLARAQDDSAELNLKEAVSLALAQNPELAAQGHELEMVEARLEAARGRRLPRVDAVGGAYYHQHDQRLLPASSNGEPGAFSDKIIAGELVVSMPVFAGGRLKQEMTAAQMLRLAADHQLARSRNELVFNVTSIFYSILAQRRVLESLAFSREALREHTRRSQEMIAVQKAATVDRLRIEVRVADLEQRMVWEKNVMTVQIRVLANLMGLPAGSQQRSPGGTLSPLPEATTETAPGFEELLAARRDYQSALATVSAQRAAVAAATAGHLPSVTVQGSYGRRLAVESPDRSDVRDSNEETGWAGLVVSMPLFAGGQIQARVREERSRLAAAQERLRKLALLIQLEYETASLNIQSARERLEALGKTSQQAEESLRIEREKYELGKGSITEVLDAQTALLDSQTSICRALADYHTAQAQMALARGE